MFLGFWKTAVPASSNVTASHHEVTEAFHLPRHSAPTRYSNSHAFANKAWPSIPRISCQEHARHHVSVVYREPSRSPTSPRRFSTDASDIPPTV
jgi:hypothetical protein